MKNKLFFLLTLIAIETSGQNVGHFYGNLDGTNSTNIKLGKKNYDSDRLFDVLTSDGGSATFTLHSKRWGGVFNWVRESSGGVDRNIAKMSGGSSGSYLQLFNHDQNVQVQLNTSGKSFINGGKVGIGTTTPTEKLEVNGIIRSKEVKVEATGWPDYVFSPNYNLRSLEETETFIQENQHLPEIPAATEIEAEGLLLGEMNALLLKKIEELTLHTIEQHKLIDQQKQLNQQLIERIEKLESNN